ncbi:unnamed protein product [Vicia faba]|uniref:AMP-activated protein kinase glycogen-binding domain-containing protein n=1 Tax=Vicia faba TaxID=3906 RepID=A0AAV0YLX8_VICFA|nr:unnamed protein product [Vicia faba]
MHSWTQTTSGYEDMYTQHAIPILITWSYGVKDISVEGSWDNWKSRTRLQRSGKDFTILKVLPSGVYQYRFVVDGRYSYAPDLPWAQDEAGNSYNILDLHDYVPEDIGSISGFEPPQSATSSYDNSQLSSEDYTKEPPLVPPHFATTLLNLRTTSSKIQTADFPLHITLFLLNHHLSAAYYSQQHSPSVQLSREVLAYLIYCSSAATPPAFTGNPKRNTVKNTDHATLFNCSCFRCYTSYWVRWDESPNRELIPEIIDAFEEWLAQSNKGGKKGKGKKREAFKKLRYYNLQP